MPRVSNETKMQALHDLETGGTVEFVADSIGVSTATVERWVQERDAEPLGVAPSVPHTKKTRGAKSKRAPISEETAGQICAGIFTLVALLDNEPAWFLDEDERKGLASPFAESLGVLPSQVSDAINTYAQPAVFLTLLGSVVKKKMTIRAHKAELKRRGVIPMRPQSVPQPPPPTAPPPPQTNARTATPEDLAAALDAARGSLIETPDIAEGHFS